MEKPEIIEYFIKNISRISQWKHRGILLENLNKNGIYFNDFNFETLNQEFSIYLFDLDKNMLKCNLPSCNNKKQYVKFLLEKDGKYMYGFKRYCSKDCKHKHRSLRQTGENNTCYKMSKETKLNRDIKNSIKMKENIKNGIWTPNITNSWTGSKIKLNINNIQQQYRSSWEAFFHLCNNQLLYEKTRITYFLNNKNHNYITDFTDEKNKIIYEIKPDKLKERKKNIIKFEAAEKWCKENGYTFVIISNDWFKQNYNKCINLLENQPDKLMLLKRLKQFEK